MSKQRSINCIESVGRAKDKKFDQLKYIAEVATSQEVLDSLIPCFDSEWIYVVNNNLEEGFTEIINNNPTEETKHQLNQVLVTGNVVSMMAKNTSWENIKKYVEYQKLGDDDAGYVCYLMINFFKRGFDYVNNIYNGIIPGIVGEDKDAIPEQTKTQTSPKAIRKIFKPERTIHKGLVA